MAYRKASRSRTTRRRSTSSVRRVSARRAPARRRSVSRSRASTRPQMIKLVIETAPASLAAPPSPEVISARETAPKKAKL